MVCRIMRSSFSPLVQRVFLFLLFIGVILWGSAARVSQWPIHGSLSEQEEPPLSSAMTEVLAQKYVPLGHGRQMWVFVSEDGLWVVKLFNHRYFTKPFWAKGFRWDSLKWERRKYFAAQSYQIAEKELADDTHIALVHLGRPSQPLPMLRVGRRHIDLQRVPFVIQKKGELLCPLLHSASPERSEAMIEEFLAMTARRIAKNICDEDRNLAGNFGVIEGRVAQLDPGRLFFNAACAQNPVIEWEKATRELHAWIKLYSPERLAFFYRAMEKYCPGIYK